MPNKFNPSFLMRNRHFQTLYSTFFRKTPQLKCEIERFILEDGDFLEAYWHTTNTNDNAPLVVLFHGLNGSYNSPYIRGIMTKLSKTGFNSVLMHFRGCSGIMNKHPRSYHSGETADALFFINSIQKRFPHTPLYAIGYSLGGNMLLKLLGELGKDSPLKAAISVSAPMQLDVCADVINSGLSLFYQKHLMQGLKKSLQKKYTKHNMQSLLNFKEKNIKNLKTFWDFDGTYTAPIHGFSSAQDYYTKCSAKQYLKYIHTKTLIIHASDDPFMNDTVLPTKDEISSFVNLELSAHGGHVGFIHGSIFNPKYWLEERIVRFLSQN